LGTPVQDEKGRFMNNVEAVMIVEGEVDTDEKTWVDAWQHLIDTGLCWKFQGWYGRQAEKMIQDGRCNESECQTS